MSIRINKVLKELNIGFQTAIQFLQERGLWSSEEQELNLNTILEGNQYQALVNAFSHDKEIKEAADSLKTDIKSGNLFIPKIKKRGKKSKIEKIASKLQPTKFKKIGQDKIAVSLKDLIFLDMYILLNLPDRCYNFESPQLNSIEREDMKGRTLFDCEIILILDRKNQTFKFEEGSVLSQVINVGKIIETRKEKEAAEKRTVQKAIAKERKRKMISLANMFFYSTSASVKVGNVRYTLNYNQFSIASEYIKEHREEAIKLGLLNFHKYIVINNSVKIFRFEDFNLLGFIETTYQKLKTRELSIVDNENKDSFSSPCGIDNVDFHDGFYYLWVLRNDGEKDTKIQPLRCPDINSFECLVYLKKYFADRMPSNLVLHYTSDKIQYVDHRIDLNLYIKVLRSNLNVKGGWWIDVQNARKRKIENCRKNSKNAIQKELSLKNVYIDYLSNHQAFNYEIIKVYEVLSSIEEDCFLFTLQSKDDKIAIVYENINPSRASEVFIIDRDNYEQCIILIFDYFTNYGIANKRLGIRQKVNTPDKFAALEYYAIDHDNLQIWSNKVLNLLNETVTANRIQFVSGLRIANSEMVRNLSKEQQVVYHLHNEIMTILYKNLLSIFGEKNVGTEIHIGQKRIDLVVKRNDKFDLYEIKTSTDVRTCIRQAFGQIVDYAYYECEDFIDNMYIIGPDKAGGIENDYLDKIRQEHHLNIYYRTADEVDFYDY